MTKERKFHLVELEELETNGSPTVARIANNNGYAGGIKILLYRNEQDMPRDLIYKSIRSKEITAVARPIPRDYPITVASF